MDGSEAGAAAGYTALDPSASAFRPLPGTAGGHRQTLLGYWLRRRLRWSLPVEERNVQSEPGVQLLLRASWQPARARRGALS